jgi:hypothetical protein
MAERDMEGRAKGKREKGKGKRENAETAENAKTAKMAKMAETPNLERGTGNREP